jgi:hypothetical protein
MQQLPDVVFFQKFYVRQIAIGIEKFDLMIRKFVMFVIVSRDRTRKHITDRL